MGATKERITLVCEGGDCTAEAEASARVFERIVIAPNGEAMPLIRKFIELPDGWTEQRLFPDGKPVLVAVGQAQVHLSDAASVARGTQHPQTIWCCPACTAKRRIDPRTRAVVEGAGIIVTGGEP